MLLANLAQCRNLLALVMSTALHSVCVDAWADKSCISAFHQTSHFGFMVYETQEAQEI